MTKNQIAQFNRMAEALRTIAREYKTPDQLKRSSEKNWGLDYEEAIEMAYENIQTTAANAVRGVRDLKTPEQKAMLDTEL